MRLRTRLISSLVLASCALAPAAANAAAIGPDPTVASVRAAIGPFRDVGRTGYSDAATPGFGAASVYYPKNAGSQRLGVVAFAPGFTESSSAVSWLAQRAASNGFVAISINVNNTFLDFPYQRAQQLLAALDFVTTSSKERGMADPTRLAVVGHSMGGGATLDASRLRPSLKAAVGLTPWNPGLQYADVTVPSLQIGAQFDFIAPVESNALPFYNSLPATTPKAFMNLSWADHFATNSRTAKVGAATISWLKRYVDDDVRYAPFICGAHTGVLNSELVGYASNC